MMRKLQDEQQAQWSLSFPPSLTSHSVMSMQVLGQKKVVKQPFFIALELTRS